jgi:tetratricopeptide (TPR) repeat protein
LLNEAINCYTRAMELDPSKAVYPANRAMCMLKQEKYGVAEVDCSLSIELDPKYAKAYFRRAQARLKLNKLREAKQDYEEVLKLEPNNKDAQSECIKIEDLIEGHRRIFPVAKTEEQRSKKPLKVVRIEEIGGESFNQAELDRNLNELRQRTKLDARDEKLFDATQKSDNSVKIEEISDKLEHVEIAPATEEKTKPVVVKVPIASVVEVDMKKTIPDRPVNGYQFKKDWQFLKDGIENLAAYFKVTI